MIRHMVNAKTYELGPDGLAKGNRPLRGSGGALGALGMMMGVILADWKARAQLFIDRDTVCVLDGGMSRAVYTVR
jgi:hypothetical protein